MRSQLFDAQHTAPLTSQERWATQSSKMLRVGLGPDVLAAKGAMVAYTGQLTFAHEGAGSMGRLVRRMISSDDAPLMRVAGQGLCYFARLAEDIFMIELEGDSISIGGSNLLAFDASLNWDIKRVQGIGAMASAGLFNTVIEGRGTVAITSDGPPMLMDCSQQPVFVDPQAILGWSANLVPGVVRSAGLGALIGRGSGEAFQLAFHGPGFAIVQPSEGAPAPAGGGGGGGIGALFG